MTDIYIVLIICLLIWGGIFAYLLHLDRQIRNLKQKFIFHEETEEK